MLTACAAILINLCFEVSLARTEWEKTCFWERLTRLLKRSAQSHKTAEVHRPVDLAPASNVVQNVLKIAEMGPAELASMLTRSFKTSYPAKKLVPIISDYYQTPKHVAENFPFTTLGEWRGAGGVTTFVLEDGVTMIRKHGSREVPVAIAFGGSTAPPQFLVIDTQLKTALLRWMDQHPQRSLASRSKEQWHRYEKTVEQVKRQRQEAIEQAGYRPESMPTILRDAINSQFPLPSQPPSFRLPYWQIAGDH